jgi:hypothetical protein
MNNGAVKVASLQLKTSVKQTEGKNKVKLTKVLL